MANESRIFDGGKPSVQKKSKAKRLAFLMHEIKWQA